MIPYKNSQLSPQERARDLLSRMTLREKLAQMRLITQTAPKSQKWKRHCRHGKRKCRGCWAIFTMARATI